MGGLSMSAAAEQVRKKEIAVRFLEWNAQLTAAEIPLVARSVARLNAAFGPEESEAKALASRVAYCYARPDWFVAEFFPWGEGELSSYAGPDTWQEGFLREWGEEIRLRGFDGVTPVTPLRFATSSG
ncbi:MAG: hypothetical protein ACJ74Z_16050, partial [Bryobacteraceae bacterium]